MDGYESYADTITACLEALRCYYSAHIELYKRIKLVESLPTVKERIPLIGLADAFEIFVKSFRDNSHSMTEVATMLAQLDATSGCEGAIDPTEGEVGDNI